jgi:hypothetical protein
LATSLAEIGRGATHGVDHDQQFHQVVVGRVGGGLHDENVLAADVFLDFHEDFLIGKSSNAGFPQGNIEIVADLVGEVPVRIARENLHCGPPVMP